MRICVYVCVCVCGGLSKLEIFQGTQKRSRLQFEEEIENIGGQLNAYTTRENTCYSMTVFKEKLEHGIEILGDILCNSLYT